MHAERKHVVDIRILRHVAISRLHVGFEGKTMSLHDAKIVQKGLPQHGRFRVLCSFRLFPFSSVFFRFFPFPFVSRFLLSLS